MGAHYNSVSISIDNSESKTSLDWSYTVTCAGLYAMYNTARLCGTKLVGFAHRLRSKSRPRMLHSRIGLSWRTQEPAKRIVFSFTQAFER